MTEIEKLYKLDTNSLASKNQIFEKSISKHFPDLIKKEWFDMVDLIPYIIKSIQELYEVLNQKLCMSTGTQKVYDNISKSFAEQRTELEEIKKSLNNATTDVTVFKNKLAHLYNNNLDITTALEQVKQNINENTTSVKNIKEMIDEINEVYNEEISMDEKTLRKCIISNKIKNDKKTVQRLKKDFSKLKNKNTEICKDMIKLNDTISLLEKKITDLTKSKYIKMDE